MESAMVSKDLLDYRLERTQRYEETNIKRNEIQERVKKIENSTLSRKLHDTFLNAFHIRPHIKRPPHFTNLSNINLFKRAPKCIRKSICISVVCAPKRSVAPSFTFVVSTYRRFHGNISFQKHPLWRIHIINLFFALAANCISRVCSLEFHSLS
ncbi:hypothetical protein CDAR_172611 [Caerostris darwini]|uniref:Uncharacterized protein n=1 Tax=Caerostris darwini TaxID=1538125 RepID=A0AAV4MG21_9ARAC|nr:hypothetical protein CDAR_172611 [Caerostris darwini]